MTRKPPGRPKGAKNKRSILVEETAMKLGFDPFKTLCLFAMGKWKELGFDSSVEVKESHDGKSTFLKYTISPELRAQCAKDACRYLYAQKQAVEMTIVNEDTDKDPKEALLEHARMLINAK